MRGKRDQKSNRRVKQKRPRPAGGKALLRLFAFLAPRDRSLNNELIERIVIPNATIPKFALPKETAASRAARILATASRKRGTRRASKSLATALSKAAKALSERPMARARTATDPVWQSIGPTSIPNGQTYGRNRIDVAGRLAAIAVDPGDPKHILVGAACGGIWESFDEGANWAPRTDQMPTLAIGAIAFDASDSKRVYAGSGEGNAFYTLGAGVYVSTDGGTNWTVLASEPFVGTGFYDLAVDPAVPATLYAATTEGFYKSTNRGSSWSRKRAGQCWKISIHPTGGKTEILAAFADGVFASTNAGDAFSAAVLPALPGTDWTRLAVDRVAAAPDVAYAFGVLDKRVHLWRRSGADWTKVLGLPEMDVEQAWYDWFVATAPDNQRQVYLGAIDTWRGDKKNETWTWRNITTQGANSIHPDQHCLAFSPGDSKVIYAGNDGGLYRSANSGKSWKSLNKGLGITEIEYMASNPGTWKWLIAGTQDNGTLRFTGSSVWDHIADGDGGDCGINKINPNIVYHSFYDVTLERSDNKGNSWTDLNPPSDYSLFYPPVEVAGQ
ncbi:MAG: WD40/YVTN/BNR-like repeat-containing protein, partial [Pseudorhodoplanes sp.]